jgi:rRNA-processing protein FCF1
MKQVILDTSFIMSCIRAKIDFFEEIRFMGMEILIPEEVIGELKKKKAETALKLLEKSEFKKIKLETKNVDKGIIDYAKETPELVVATLDKKIKISVKNSKLIIRNKKKLEII